ncbi:hypothetical protein GGR53DRAFT_345597 [Hypoxylon sp. FL1150]|nr:hypothetical protein GGR53DRAFT_345597 [Hypoxylon sp. FL1150]
MANDDTPQMPPAASSNMAMSMSTVPAISKKSSDLTVDSTTSKQDASKGTDVQPRPSLFKNTKATANGQSTANARRDQPSNREIALNIQRIQLAEKLGDERKQRKNLEARISSLQDEVAELSSTNKALDMQLSEERKQHETAKLSPTNKYLHLQRDEFAKQIGYERKLHAVLETRIDSLQDEIAELTSTNKALEADRSRLREEIEWTDLQLEESLITQRAKMDGDTQRAKTEEDTQERISNLEVELAEATKNFQQAILNNNLLQETSMAESQEMQKSLKELQRSTMPFNQTIVIGVDLSGSTAPFDRKIKNAYRDVLHMIKSNNSDAKVSVVVHGAVKLHPSPAKAISDTLFKHLDDIEASGTEDYKFCLEQACKVFQDNINSNRLLILIGDGEAEQSRVAALYAACQKLLLDGIKSHSIALPNGSRRRSQFDWTMERISQITGGRVEYQYTYMAAIEELLRKEREQYFRQQDEST